MGLAYTAALVAILVPALVLAANAGPASASTDPITTEPPPLSEQETPSPTDGACPGGGYDPVPVEVGVEAVPIVVESTTEEYFVLYVRHDLDGTVLELPVSVTLGENGTSTLAENVEALPKERYLVEKFPHRRPGRRRRRLHRRHHRTRRPGGHESGEPSRRHRAQRRRRGRSRSGDTRRNRL